MPGQRTVDAGMTPRIILMADQGVIELPGPLVIDSVNAYDGANTGRTDELLAGLIMAQITASKKWVPVKRTRVKTGTTGTVTALTVDNARSFVAGEKITVGADTALLISSVNYATNTLTIPSTAVVDGEEVYVTTFADGTTSAAGAEIGRCILKESLRLLDGVQFSTSKVDKAFVGIIAGYVNSAMILSDYASVLAATDYLDGIRWSHLQQP